MVCVAILPCSVCMAVSRKLTPGSSHDVNNVVGNGGAGTDCCCRLSRWIWVSPSMLLSPLLGIDSGCDNVL